MSYALQTSLGGCLVRSSGGWFNQVPGPTSFYNIIGYYPVCGMGTFNSSANMDNVSPNMARTKWCWYERYMAKRLQNTDHYILNHYQPNVPGRNGTLTNVYQYQDYCDVPVLYTQTISPSDWTNEIGTIPITSYTPTQIQAVSVSTYEYYFGGVIGYQMVTQNRYIYGYCI